MLNISKIGMYRDGGTISMKCVMAISWTRVPYLEERRNQEIELCIDGRLGRTPEFWLGYPGKEDSVPIQDPTIIDYIIKKAGEYKARQNQRLDQFINFRENVRDWKIKNILE